MSLKSQLRRKGLELMGDPRVSKLMQRDDVMRALMTIVQVPGRLEGFTSEQADRLAAVLRLATAREVRELRRGLHRLETEVSELRRELGERG